MNIPGKISHHYILTNCKYKQPHTKMVKWGAVLSGGNQSEQEAEKTSSAVLRMSEAVLPYMFHDIQSRTFKWLRPWLSYIWDA